MLSDDKYPVRDEAGGGAEGEAAVEGRDRPGWAAVKHDRAWNYDVDITYHDIDDPFA